MAKRKLKPLPKSSDREFWKDADVTTTTIKSVKCEHDFSKNTERTLKCKNCGMGLYLDFRDEFKNGHLYRDGKLVF